jgi:hypothetical protein
MVAAPVAAQDAYPNRPVRWVVPFPAGGPTDTLSRILAAKLGEQWGQSVVIENKGGASGAIGSDAVAKAPPDGYTLILGTQSTHGSNLIFFPNLPYDPIKDFQPLALIGTACMALVTAPSVPANTPKELVEWIRKQDGGVNYASAAPGSSQHVAAELLVKRAGLQATHVPYRGSSAAMPDLMSGRVTFMFDNLPSALPQARAGKVKAFPRLRDRGLVRHLRAGQDAAADRRQAVGRHQQGAQGSRVDGTLEGAGLRSDRRHARAIRRAPEGRSRLLEADDRVHRHQSGVGRHGDAVGRPGHGVIQYNTGRDPRWSRPIDRLLRRRPAA